MQSPSFKPYRKFILAAAFAASAVTSVFAPSGASAFGFHGGLGSFHGGGFHAAPMTPHFAGLRDPGFGRHPGLGGFPGGHGPICFHRCGPVIGQLPPRPPVPAPVCFHGHCGPVKGGPAIPPVLLVTVGAIGVSYYYGDQPIYYRNRLVHAAAACGGPAGTYVLMGFVPTATAEQITAFLQNYKVAISDGPAEDSVFVIKLGDQRLSGQEVETAMAAMQAETAVVRLISAPNASAQN